MDEPCVFCSQSGYRTAGELKQICNVCHGVGFRAVPITRREMREIDKLAAASLADDIAAGRAKVRIEPEDIAFKRGP